ncbi:MAG: DNA repair protein RecN [Flavobacteriaceae bacterium]|nr:DNA repair protein RecN [Flavobacteriaceae bacterium]
MLTSLTIHNYALIEELHVDFTEGLTMITGETGAGKSILLGALGLVLGNRADLNSLKDISKKCVIEAVFRIDNYNLSSFFQEENIDFELETIIRREILPGGKSRAFINDTPVNLTVLSALNSFLIDVHSQNQTLAITQKDFQFEILDALANHKPKVESYKRGLVLFKNLQKEYSELLTQQNKANEQHDYNSFLFNELAIANLKETEQEELEELLERLNHIEVIKQNLGDAIQLSENEEIGIDLSLKKFKINIQRISSYARDYEDIYNRFESIFIEYQDILSEIENAFEKLDVDPLEIENLNQRLQLIYSLQKKHHLNSISDLLVLQDELAEKIKIVENASEVIKEKELEIKNVEVQLNQLALEIHQKRLIVIPDLTSQLEFILKQLGMPNAQFQIVLNLIETFSSNGKDEIEWLFSANKGSNLGELRKVASGGEMSRIMLAIKSVLSNYSKLPTIIFDEIDTGISGEVANKMAEIMQQMASNMQVITITHLPQIAAKGVHHFKVFKMDEMDKTKTQIRKLSKEERIEELAEMLGGKLISASAIEHAKELLN